MKPPEVRRSFLDLFSDKADLYASARPVYPDELFEFVASVAPSTEKAWDCGTGNGQAAVSLARHFKAVAATDPSAQQIANTILSEGVHYSVQPAEETNFPAASFDAICVAQALHWFDFERFYREARRVLKPDGVLVAWGYDWFKINPEFDKEFEHSILDVLRPYWVPQNSLVWNGYRDVPFPFSRIEAPKLHIRVSWSFHQLLAYVHTWSATRRCMSNEGNEFFEKAELALAPLWGAPGQMKLVTMPLHLLAGRYKVKP